MQRQPNTLVRFVLVLSAAWSVVGMEIHACSGPLSPGSCLQVLCSLVLPEALLGAESTEVPVPDLGDSSESPPQSSHATARGVDPSSAARSQRSLLHRAPSLGLILGAGGRIYTGSTALRPEQSPPTDHRALPLVC